VFINVLADVHEVDDDPQPPVRNVLAYATNLRRDCPTASDASR
jgi:hypothetical protein